MIHVPVVYHEKMSVNIGSFSPSSRKPKIVVEHWLHEKEPILLVQGQKATRQDLYMVHDPKYVDDVLDLRIPNGFGTRRAEASESFLYTTGGMLTALQLIAQYPVVCVPVSGFHHARTGSGGGFCTFNGGVLAAVQHGGKVAMVDNDMHFGDGTANCLEVLSLGHRVKHASFGKWFHTPEDAPAYLAKLNKLWSSGWFDGVELILYQAGADVHVDDPLGGVLTTEQMRERDDIMFQNAKFAGIPLVWVFAGGYQSPLSKVVELHTNTLHACMEAYL